MHGHGVYKYPSGAIYQGEYKDGYRHGQGTYKNPKGETYIGGYVKDKREG